MNKAYNAINWKNEPSTSTAINETNLNKMDRAIDEIDNRVIDLDNGKVNKEDGKSLVPNTDIPKIGANEKAIQTINNEIETINSVLDDKLDLVDGVIDETKTEKTLDIPDVSSSIFAPVPIQDETWLGAKTGTAIQKAFSLIKSLRNATKKDLEIINNNKLDKTSIGSSVNSFSYEEGISMGFATTETLDEDVRNHNAALFSLGKSLNDMNNDINNNLVQLEFDELSGGKNLLKTNNASRTSAGNFIYEEIILNAGSYVISYTPSVSCDCQIQVYDSNNNVLFNSSGFRVTANQRGSKGFTISSNSARIEFYANSSTGGTLSNIMLESGTVLHDYEPYIPSVKMLADEVKAQNDSLEEYGLNNVFDGNWSQGSYEGADSSIIHITNRVPCNGNETVRLISNKNEQDINIHYFDSSLNWITYNNMHTITDATFVTPSNAKYIGVVAYNDNGISIENAPSIKLYVGNEIDKLKNDLKPVMLGQFDSSSSGDLSESITNFTYINIVGIKPNGMEIVTEIAPISFLLNGYKYNIGNTGSTFACTDINASVSMNNLVSVRVYGIRR